MLRCAICEKPLRECCDIFYEAEDEAGNSVVICGDCAAEHDLPFEDEKPAEKTE